MGGGQGIGVVGRSLLEQLRQFQNAVKSFRLT
jgi:hypothetical protein